MRTINIILSGLFVYWVIGLLSPLKATAATMSNDRYTIEKQNIDIQPFSADQPRKAKTPEHKPLSQGQRYIVDSILPDAFSFTISTDLIDFGKLTATNPVIRDLTVGVRSTDGYQILTAQDHPLRDKPDATIPDTTCDNGSCSEFTEAVWLNTLTYGFGYHTNTMENDAYKQFADTSRNESAQPLTPGKITLRVNISGTQQAGSYTNIITFIATPNF